MKVSPLDRMKSCEKLKRNMDEDWKRDSNKIAIYGLSLLLTVL